jgi:hypothetical protein
VGGAAAARIPCISLLPPSNSDNLNGIFRYGTARTRVSDSLDRTRRTTGFDAPPLSLSFCLSWAGFDTSSSLQANGPTDQTTTEE